MYYVIMTSTGFKMNGSETATYDFPRDAMEYMSPGDQIVGIQRYSDLEKYKSGEKKLPPQPQKFGR